LQHRFHLASVGLAPPPQSSWNLLIEKTARMMA
jgi:hypothetical protein